MSRIIVSVTVILFLATASQATTVIQKNFGYYYETAKDTGSDREYVVCDETRSRFPWRLGSGASQPLCRSIQLLHLCRRKP